MCSRWQKSSRSCSKGGGGNALFGCFPRIAIRVDVVDSPGRFRGWFIAPHQSKKHLHFA